MRTPFTLLGSLVILALGASSAMCQDRTPNASSAPGAPGVITQGSDNVVVGGQTAAGKGDATDSAGAVVEGSSNVFINGKPAARVGDRTGCGGVIVGGSSNVFVNGRPLARTGDLATGCN